MNTTPKEVDRSVNGGFYGPVLLWIAIVLAALFTLTVPWFFIGSGAGEVGGWPDWVVYTLAMNVVFGVVTAVLLGRYWHRLENVSEEDQDQP